MFTKEVTVDTLSLPAFKSRFPTVALHLGVVSSVDPSRHTLEFTPYEGVASTLHFSKLCIACGSSPLPGPLPSLRWTLEPFVHTIRDRSSVLSLSTLSKDAAKRVAVVGNGGVAMEVVHALTSLPSGPEVDWIVRDNFLGHAMLDASAAAFIVPGLVDRMRKGGKEGREKKRRKTVKTYNGDEGIQRPTPMQAPTAMGPRGNSLGPYWYDTFRPSPTAITTPFQPKTNATCACHSCPPGVWCMPSNAGDQGQLFLPDSLKSEEGGEGRLKVLYGSRVAMIRRPGETVHHRASGFEGGEGVAAEKRENEEGRGTLVLDTGETISFDALVIGCGVSPRSPVDAVLGAGKTQFERGEDGGLKVDRRMECVGVEGVYAAGDCCDLEEFVRENELFHQMRLWSQARQEGSYAARCMVEDRDEEDLDFWAECFGHQTDFLGKRVVLLGLFNGQKIGGGLNEFLATENGLVEEGEDKDSVMQGGLTRRGGEKMVKPEEETTMHNQNQSIVSTKSLKEGDIKILTRVTTGKEYVKCVVSGGRVVGAMLVGESVELADTMEQIMLSRINVDALGFDLLDDNVDLEGFFD